MKGTTLVLLAASVVIAFRATAQGQPSTANRRWTLAVGLGWTPGGPAGDLERVMREAGLNEPDPSSLPPLQEAPYSDTGGLAPTLGITFAISRHLGLGLIASEAPTGVTYGHRDPDVTMIVRHFVQTVSPVIVARVGGVAEVRGGPAWHRTVAENARLLGPGTQVTAVSTLGFVVDAGLTIPSGLRTARWLFVAEVRVQYRHVGRAAAGPFTVTGDFSGQVVTVPATRLRYDHWYLGFGVGVKR